jgi:hypothetical protein
MASGTIAGTEIGAQAIEYLKRLRQVNTVVGIFFIIVLVSISAFMAWESWLTIKMKKKGANRGGGKADQSAISNFSVKIQRFKLPPMIKLSASGITQISLWIVLLVAFVGGIFAGFLGGGAGYIRMPSLVYVLGVPTHVAVGTDLFEVMISASYGTLTHAIKGNVDILIALVMHTGAAVGAQIGVVLTEHFGGPRIRLAFAPLPLIGAALIVYSLLTGTQLK